MVISLFVAVVIILIAVFAYYFYYPVFYRKSVKTEYKCTNNPYQMPSLKCYCNCAEKSHSVKEYKNCVKNNLCDAIL